MAQIQAAKLFGISSRTIRHWLNVGLLKRRSATDSRVRLEDVERLARRTNRPGPKAGARGNLWLPFIVRDARGLWLVAGEPVAATEKMAGRIHNVNDLVRLLEIRLLSYLIRDFLIGYCTDEILNFDALARHSNSLAALHPVKLEEKIDQLLPNSSWWDIRVLAARFLHWCVREQPPAQGWRIPTKQEIEELQRDARREQIEDWLRPPRACGNEELTSHIDRVLRELAAWRVTVVAGYFGYDGWSELTEEERLAELRLRIKRAVSRGDLELRPIFRPRSSEDWEVIRQMRDQRFKETKYGRRASGTEPTRGTKRCYPFQFLLGTNRRVASYWKRKSEENWLLLYNLFALPRVKVLPAAHLEKLLLSEEGKDCDDSLLANLNYEIVESFLSKLKSDGRWETTGTS